MWRRTTVRRMVQWLSLGVAVISFLLSLVWRGQAQRSARAASDRADEALRVARASAAAQSRIANLAPWRTEWKGGFVLFRNQTGGMAKNVRLSVDAPWYFADHGETAWAPDLASLRHGDLHAGAAVVHALTVDSGPHIDGRLMVTWEDPDGDLQYWEEPTAWAVLPEE